MYMPRKNLIRSNSQPYHVTSRANNKEWFTLPMEDVWELTKKCLKEANEKHRIELISFVLMSNHYHMLVKTPEGNLDKFMYEFNKRLAQNLRDSSGRINHIFGGRYKWCLIQSQTYFLNCYRYVYQNPIRAELAIRCENYPYSSLYSLVYGREFPVPLHDSIGFKDVHLLNWLNEKIHENEVNYLRDKLKRSEFKEQILRSSRRKLCADAKPNV